MLIRFTENNKSPISSSTLSKLPLIVRFFTSINSSSTFLMVLNNLSNQNLLNLLFVEL